MTPSPFVRCIIVSLAFLLCSVSQSPAQEYLTNSGLMPIAGADHDYVHGLSEIVNPSNGSLSIRVPIPLPRGRGVTLPFGLAYDSSSFHVIGGPQGAQWNGASTWTYMLPGLSSEKLPSKLGTQTCYYYAGYVFVAFDRVSHPLGLMKPIGQSACANGLLHRLTGGNEIVSADVTTTPKIADADGTTYIFSSDQGWLTSIEDRNGNLVTLSVPLNQVDPLTATDTLGRTVLTISSFLANPPTVTTITVPGVGGNYTVNWQSPSVNFATSWTNFTPNLSCVLPTPEQGTLNAAVSSITLPNGKSFQFTYDPTYGQVSKITYPSGGYVSYSWGLNPQSAGGDFHTRNQSSNLCELRYDTPAILHRYVSCDGSTMALQQDFSYSTTWSTGWSSKQTIVTTHDLVRGTQFQTIYTYVPTPSGDPNQPGTEGTLVDFQLAGEATVTYKDTNGTTLKTENKSWYDIRELKTDDVTLDNGLTSQTAYTYGPGAQITEKDEYDYGAGAPGSLLRKTVYNHQSFANTAIFPNIPSIFDRPCQIVTYDSSGTNRVAETDYFYDNGATTTVCGAAGTPSVAAAGGTSLTGHDETNYSPSATGPRGNITQHTRWLNTGSSAVTTYSYDETGQVLSMTDPCGNVTCSDMTGTSHTTTYSYADSYSSGSPPGNTNAYLTQTVHPTVNGVSHVESFSYGYADGQLSASNDENGQTTSYIYNDNLDRLTEVDYPDGGKMTRSYNDAAPSPSVMQTTLSTSALSRSTTTTLDGLGHVTNKQLTTDPDGADSTDITHDGLGQVHTRSNPHRSSSLPTDGTTTYTYDTLGRTTMVIQADGSFTTTGYSGNCATVTDEALKYLTSCSDGLGRLTQVLEPGNGVDYETDYVYDALDNLASVTQKGGDPDPANWRSRSFVYDSLSRLTSATNPESGTILYSYDADGNLASKVAPDPNQTSGSVTSYDSYDTLSRLTMKRYAGIGTPAVQYGYDNVALSGCTTSPPTPNPPDAYPIGRQTSMCDASGATAWTHDKMGRTLQDKRTLVGTTNVTKAFNYTYNLDGSLATLQYPSVRTITYGLKYSGSDTSGQLLSAKDLTNGINYVTTASYAPQGALGYMVMSGTIKAAMSYNSRLQPLQIFYGTNAVPSITGTSCPTGYGNIMHRVYHLGLGVNDNGNVQSIDNCRDTSRTANYTYDSLNRITQGNSTGSEWGDTYTLDAWGNLTNITPILGRPTARTYKPHRRTGKTN